jgi:organic hydroperoxide reductase OsmC/OhrA
MSTARVDFTRGAAERIAAVVRLVEQGNRDGAPLTFRKVGTEGSGGGVRRGTFTGPWGVGETRVVTLLDGSATASVTNYCVDSIGEDDSTERAVLFSRAAGTNAVVEIQRGPTTGFCGTYQGPDLITLSFSACHGTGAAAVADEPGGVFADDAGPITSITITSPGSGYAVKARVEPAVVITGSGTGATFTATFSEQSGDCGIPYWEIKSATVSGGGGYVHGETLTVEPASGSTVELPATLTLNTIRSEPTLQASAAGGSGASLSVSVTQNGGSPDTWRVTGISVSSGGSGYPDLTAVTIIPGSDDVEQQAAIAFARTERIAPTVSASASSGGVGALLSPTLSQSTDGQGLDVWSVSGFTISNGGSGYSVSNPISVVVTDGVQQQGAIGAVASVHTATGAILSASVAQGGQFYKTNGVLDAVIVSDGGKYYKENPDSVTVVDGGRYYQEDASATPYTTPITVTISQISPSVGSNADVSPVVDDDTSSPTFGEITGVTINNGGTDYLAWEERQSLLEQGIDFGSIEGFDIGQIQVLGHGESACLQWFNITTCGTATASV